MEQSLLVSLSQREEQLRNHLNARKEDQAHSSNTSLLDDGRRCGSGTLKVS
eukprot:m.140317 g.140317  ORF g.140317 m.140317 type:complete len:51 (-) comp52568_c2_seq32:318-470(-)